MTTRFIISRAIAFSKVKQSAFSKVILSSRSYVSFKLYVLSVGLPRRIFCGCSTLDSQNGSNESLPISILKLFFRKYFCEFIFALCILLYCKLVVEKYKIPRYLEPLGIKNSIYLKKK